MLRLINSTACSVAFTIQECEHLYPNPTEAGEIMGDRVILHSDTNSFYASVEQAEHPELRGKPIAVAGKQELRHGIILTKSKEARRFGITPPSRR